MDDPLAGVLALTGVGAAAAHARSSIDALLRHPAMRRDAARVAAEAAVRGAQASAQLAGGSTVSGAVAGGSSTAAEDDPDAVVGDPVLQGALRLAAEVPALADVWLRSPRQALARMHLVAARDLVADDDALGRPRPGADGARLDQLLRIAFATTAPGVVVAAIVHGELLALSTFGTADDVVARAAERVVLVARGVDTKAVSVPEAGHLALARAYLPLAEAYATGRTDGVAAWVRHCADAYARGAEVGLTIAASMRTAPRVR
ncbi:oxidoreductase [Jiangella asiatica]|uniref:Oxidoreductase n=1 Tax=Jiangella asiatica TaxID=2530372 RepID=A0A4R5CMP7_9ACTN|nr:oxidoreductase [Jiangella asiatica]TDE00510.1 oxidoreductase [Jiangella asiatica]